MAMSFPKKTFRLSTQLSNSAIRPGIHFKRFATSFSQTKFFGQQQQQQQQQQQEQQGDFSNDLSHFKAPRKYNNHKNQKYMHQKRKMQQLQNNNNDGDIDLGDGRISGESDDPKLYRVFFRSPDKIRSLEDAQVFISHIKFNYGPLTQYQFSRCPETKRYFGYGFLTFKKEESLKKALADEYIRVGTRDFELKRTGHIPSRWTPIHNNTGFWGFYDLDELRANKAKMERDRINRAKENNSSSSGSQSDTIEADSNVKNGSSDNFVSALSPSFGDANSTTGSEASVVEAEIINDDSTESSSSSKSSNFSFQKKGLAQLWKTIPAKINKAEASSAPDSKEESQRNSANSIISNNSKIAESVGVLSEDLK
ncbi:hypothetical protein BGZ46_005244 [Entomortierella lignicola]|nr:hypothetical protein BGZ46_005244 [Entomortierella lignicola]